MNIKALIFRLSFMADRFREVDSAFKGELKIFFSGVGWPLGGRREHFTRKKVTARALKWWRKIFRSKVNKICVFHPPPPKKKLNSLVRGGGSGWGISCAQFRMPTFTYWVTQMLPQICSVILRICIGKVAWFAVTSGSPTIKLAYPDWRLYGYPGYSPWDFVQLYKLS